MACRTYVGEHNQGNPTFVVWQRCAITLVDDENAVSERRNKQLRPREYNFVSITRGCDNVAFCEFARIVLEGLSRGQDITQKASRVSTRRFCSSLVLATSWSVFNLTSGIALQIGDTQ